MIDYGDWNMEPTILVKQKTDGAFNEGYFSSEAS